MAISEWLLVQLPGDAGGVPSWVAVDASGALREASSGQADAAALAAMAVGRKVALVAPPGDVALLAAPLPAGNETRLQQLAPFALEEQVSEDLEELHFAVGLRDAQTGLVPVAVVRRERIAQWLQQAAAMSLRPSALFAAGDLVPLLPGHITMVVAGEELLLRSDSSRPVALPADDPELALSAVCGSADLSSLNLAVYATPEDWSRHQAALELLRTRVASLTVQLLANGLLPLQAQGIVQNAPVNLLQGAFRQHSPGAGAWQRWRVAAALLLGLLVLHLGASLWELHRVRQATAGVDQSIERVYGTIFPGQKPDATPRRTIEARLRTVSGGSSARGELMELLGALAAARQNVPVTTLKSVAFKTGSLQLDVSAPNGETLEQFTQALRSGGYQASIVGGEQKGGRFEGQVRLAVAGS